ncbi:MAG: hypothetical protein AUI57_03115 [Candidatus Rokubacteria bacterium 13_1_40CM_2_68_8]|nr:MAG: hypothetical protein AUI57_03115 [Candidatus Rokubacteria bacterium 13_1_40CM_2_68_8]
MTATVAFTIGTERLPPSDVCVLVAIRVSVSVPTAPVEYCAVTSWDAPDARFVMLVGLVPVQVTPIPPQVMV